MRIEQLRYLSDLQHTNSITKTARRFFTTPQSVSSNLLQLERELGTRLLDRSNMGVALTSEALKLLKASDPFLHELDKLSIEFESDEQKKSGNAPQRLDVLCSSVLAELALPKAISDWTISYPNTKVSVKQKSYTDVFRALENGKCDLALLTISSEDFLSQAETFGIKSSNFNIMLIDRLVAVVSSRSTLAKKESIDASDIVSRNFTHLNIGSRIDDPSTHSDMTLYTGANIEFHRRAIIEQDAIALMPRYVYLGFFNDKHHVCKPIDGARRIIYHVAVYPDERTNAIAKCLVNILTNAF